MVQTDQLCPEKRDEVVRLRDTAQGPTMIGFST
jgi:hypothetical protein